jgi:hypothetical protein
VTESHGSRSIQSGIAGLPEKAVKAGLPGNGGAAFFVSSGPREHQMSINGIYNKYDSYRFGFGYIDTIQRLRAATPARNKVTTSIHRERSFDSMEHAMRMRKALEAVKATMVDPEEIQVVSPASAESVASLGLDTTGTPTTVQSTEEVNAAQTSYSPAESDWSGSTAQVTISGQYDGSNGTDTLTFTVTRDGTHGADDLQLKVYDSDNNEIDIIDIKKEDPLDTPYALSNGLVLELGEGDLLDNDTFTMDVAYAAPTTLNGQQPPWEGLVSNAQATIDGTYDGSNGTGTLTFKVNSGGTHGEDDLQIKVYDPENNEIEQFDIKKEDELGRQYTLSNGLTFTLGEGDLLKNDTFTLAVSDSEPTSFLGHQPNWNGLGISDASVTLDGTYNGADGIGTFNFVVDRGGTHGQDDLIIKVYSPDGSHLEDINIDKEDPLDTQYTLSNGILFSLGEGDLLNTDSFSLTFTETIGSTVDPDKPFNGTGNDSPKLEYGLSVTDGSFQINGIAIDVNADDSINTVIDRVNQSEAGVTATFDAAAEKVVLTQETPGSDHEINLTNDTSGFLAAVKLDQATPAPGEDPETEKPLAEVAAFSSVQNGNISVNGESISIDINTDSLTDVLDRITASNAEVSASFDSSSQRVSLNSDNPDNQLILDSGITNFFSAAGITDGTYNSLNDLIQAEGIDVINAPDLTVEYVKTFSTDSSDQEVETNSVTAADGKMLGSLVNIIASSMNALFDGSSRTSSPTAKTEGIQNSIRSAISSSFGSEGPQYDTDFGIHFDFQETEKGVFNFSEANQHQLEATLITPDGEAAVRNALFGEESNGLFNQLHSALTAAVPGSGSAVYATGLFLDIVV